jgi:hypothetical protein
MAGDTDDPFNVFLVRLKFDRIVAFPRRCFLMDKVFFANSSSTYDTNSHSIRIFALSGTFVTLHYFPSKSGNPVLSEFYPHIFRSEIS